MSWKQVMPGGTQRSTLGVSMSYRLGHGKNGRRQLFVYLGPDVLKDLGWELHHGVGVYFGQGEHANKLRVAGAARGNIRIRNMGSTYRKLGITFQVPPGFPAEDRSYPSEPVDYEIKGGGVEITLPLWARARTKPAFTDVTASLMGDPVRRRA